MNSSQPFQSPQLQIQSIKTTSEANTSNLYEAKHSDPAYLSYQNSEIAFSNLKENSIPVLENINVYELLNLCDQLIDRHSFPQKKPVNRKVMSLTESMRENECPKECSECRYHLLKEIAWNKQKSLLQNKIKDLEIKLSQFTDLLNTPQNNLSTSKSQKFDLFSNVISIDSRQFEEVGFISQVPSPESTSIIRSQDCSSEPIQETEVLLQSIKVFNDKLFETQAENKYLKIQNRTLMKTKTQIEAMKRQIERTKSQRDMFKKKLITLAQKHNTPSKHNARNLSENSEKNIISGLKQRGLQTKKKNDSLFELSLTDASSIWQKSRQQQKRNERVNFIKSCQE